MICTTDQLGVALQSCEVTGCLGEQAVPVLHPLNICGGLGEQCGKQLRKQMFMNTSKSLSPPWADFFIQPVTSVIQALTFNVVITALITHSTDFSKIVNRM